MSRTSSGWQWLKWTLQSFTSLYFNYSMSILCIRPIVDWPLWMHFRLCTFSFLSVSTVLFLFIIILCIILCYICISICSISLHHNTKYYRFQQYYCSQDFSFVPVLSEILLLLCKIASIVLQVFIEEKPLLHVFTIHTSPLLYVRWGFHSISTMWNKVLEISANPRSCWWS